MQIRKWLAADNKAISELEKLCFAYPWSEEMIIETASNDNFSGFVVIEDEKVVGYAGAVYAADTADIALVAVSPDYLRRGYGYALVCSLSEELFSTGIENIFLEVRASNSPAFGLYRKCGFIPVGIRKKYYENAEDAIVMLKKR